MQPCRRWGRAVVVVTVLVAAGCGAADVPAQKGPLTEQQIQQLKDLDAQRQAEWGKPKRK